jgi:hypothetical protein
LFTHLELGLVMVQVHLWTTAAGSAAGSAVDAVVFAGDQLLPALQQQEACLA